MGTSGTVGFNRFPKQGRLKDRLVRVCFDYDTTQTIDGIVIRDDTEEPGILIIQLTDGRVVLATECQYTLR